MKNSTKTLFVILAALFLTFAVFGQEATEEPDMTETSDVEMTEMPDTDNDMEINTLSDAIESSLEEIAGNSEDFFGQRVTLEGNIETFINAKTFILGEEAIVDNDQLIVFNMTNETFDLEVSNDAQVILTGVILPSFTFKQDGVDETIYWQPLVAIDEMMNFVVNPLQFFYDGELEDQYDVYTVLVVEDVQNINVLSDDDGVTNDETNDAVITEMPDMEMTEEADE